MAKFSVEVWLDRGRGWSPLAVVDSMTDVDDLLMKAARHGSIIRWNVQNVKGC